MRRATLAMISVFAVAALGSAAARAQDLLHEALSSFPADTVHLEVSSPASLRKLPDYSSLRTHYLGPQLQQLESSLRTLGIHESDIDTLALGWTQTKRNSAMFGIAVGNFDTAAIEKSAQQRAIAPDKVAGYPAYCLGAGLETECALLLSDTEGAFGTLATLNRMMDAKNGSAPNLASDEHFTSLVHKANTEAAIWGVAKGAAASEWLGTWMPSRQDVTLDWSQVLSSVNAITYSIVPSSGDVKLAIRFMCASSNDATSLRQVLTGLKLAQQIAWQDQSPKIPNPFAATEISADGSDVKLSLKSSFQALTAAGAP